MKKILLIILLLLAVKVYSQNTILDVIYFKNGTTLKGVITELIPGVSLKITDRNGKDFTISLTDVERIEKENFNRDDYLNRPKYDSIYYSSYNFTNMTKVGLVRNISDYKNNFTFSDIFSFQFNTFSVGIGASYIKYASGYTVPVFIDTRYTFNTQKTKPYFYIDLGHSVSDDKGKGIFFQAGTGIRLSIKNNIGLIFDAAYSYQKVKYDVSGYNIIDYRDNLHLCTGIQF